MDRLVAYNWPGNVRELKHVVERAAILSRGNVLELGDSLGIETLDRRLTLDSERLDDLESSHITQVLKQCGWKIKGKGNAADRLGINPSTLHYRLKKFKITRPT